jgi:hypothetical protein
MSKLVTFHFEDEALADDFLIWLSNSGEQEFTPDDEPYGVHFDYHSYNKNGEFGPRVNVTRHPPETVVAGDG